MDTKIRSIVEIYKLHVKFLVFNKVKNRDINNVIKDIEMKNDINSLTKD